MIHLASSSALLSYTTLFRSLDPMGMVEFRELIRKLNREKGLTVLISSHILSELHQLATCFGIIHEGKLLEELSAKELDEKDRKSTRLNSSHVAISYAVFCLK